MKRMISILVALTLLAVGGTALALEPSEGITVISREDGSGTRSAFVELLGIATKNDAGQMEDMTTDEAIISNATSVVLTGVAGDTTAIGYISLGSLNDSVKALAVDGVMPSIDTVKAGAYALSRPFTIATAEGASDAAQDFIAFILSAQGQQVIEDSGYIAAAADAPDYVGSATGRIVVAGSSSVTPVMEKLKEAYLRVNSGVEMELQQSDSTTGMHSTIDGICDIGMASRALKDSELAAGLSPTVIAMDGIAVIVNNENPLEDLAGDTIRQIFTGEIATWAQAGVQ